MSNYYEEDVGIHFDPTDEELIKSYLTLKLRGEACGDIIATKDVYAKEPWLLVDHTNDPFFMEDVWYYFTPKKQVSEKKIGCGKNSKRRISGDNDGIDRGGWKQNYKENIIDEETGNIIGTKENLTYTTRNKKKLKRGDGTSALVPVPGSEYSWIMNEYMLPDDGQFQTLVLCKIHKTKNLKNKDKNPHESSASSEQQPININSESVVADSSEHQQPLSWGANESEIPHTERTREQSGEENIVRPQVEALLMTERVPEERDEQVEATDEWIGDYMDELETLNGSGSTDQNLLAQFASICFQRS
ncbi:NAC domain-containing protein 22 [Cardamine amara subsp. amara]|uniref:NAC domain-containing protein 22 n=1 Tax=Cardamine amara subsp. amara TaxID=228776 RepID=A0ABD1AP34_CARAN